MSEKKQETALLPAKIGFQLGLEKPITARYWDADIPLVPGTIGQFCADRAPPWDHFVLVEAIELNKNTGPVAR